MLAEKAYSGIVVELAYDYNANCAYFDGIGLFKEEFGSTYTYDGNGNVKSVRDMYGQTTNYEYEENDLTKILEGNQSKMTYEYDSHHNILTATTATGLVYRFGYDTYGNNGYIKGARTEAAADSGSLPAKHGLPAAEGSRCIFCIAGCLAYLPL